MSKLAPSKVSLLGELESLKAELLSMRSGMVMCLDRVDAVIDSVKNSGDDVNKLFVEPTIGATDEAVKGFDTQQSGNGNVICDNKKCDSLSSTRPSLSRLSRTKPDEEKRKVVKIVEKSEGKILNRSYGSSVKSNISRRIQISKDKVERIAGKKGRVMAKIMDATGVVIKVLDGVEEDEQVIEITGVEESAIENAEDWIDNILNRETKTTSVSKLCKRSLLQDQGKQIKEIAKSTGARIGIKEQVSNEKGNDEWVVEVTGKRSSVEDAIDMIKMKAREFEESCTLPLSQAEVKCLLGNKGAILKEIGSSTGTSLTVFDDPTHKPVIEIKGDSASVEKASRIVRIIKPRKCFVSEDDFGALIGCCPIHNGSIHKAIEESSGPVVYFDWENQMVEIRRALRKLSA